jgi:outer membrane cobalamin receptor
LRTSRHLFEVEPASSTLLSVPYAYWTAENFDLGNASSLNIGALYRITDAFSAFVKVENVLSKHWLITTEFENQGIHGLFGVTYKF